jgi:hypothetical protein
MDTDINDSIISHNRIFKIVVFDVTNVRFSEVKWFRCHHSMPHVQVASLSVI